MITHQYPFLKRIVIGCMLFWSFTAYSQRVNLSGTVISYYGDPVPGLTLTLDNTQMKVTTDKDGKFSFFREGTSVINTQKSALKSSSPVKNFVYIDKFGQLPSSFRDNQSHSPIVIYDLTGRSFTLTGRESQLPKNMAPGVYFTKIDGEVINNSSRNLTTAKTAAVDKISISFKDSLRQTVSVESYTDTLTIQLTVRMHDRWPQVHAGDKMPKPSGLKVGPYVTGVTTSIHNNGYVVMLIGSDRPACITDQLARNRLDDLDKGLTEVIEVVGFPAYPEWKKGYFLNWVVLNTGIPGATLPQNGGHQGNRWGHMNFESTPHNPCEWTTYEAGGALHECVHALIAELRVYNNPASGWLHEGFNNYLTTMANGLVRKNYSMGWTASLHLNMPQIPVESMGMTADGYVAGPADQGMSGKTYISTQHRYGGEIFFLALAQVMGRGFGISLFTTPTSGSRLSILQVFHSVYGDQAYAGAIMSYAAKSAILDFDEWTETMRSLMRSRWNNNYWFYTFPASGNGTTAFRPPLRNTPHHQGRNVIPIALASGATSVTVEFTPDARGSKNTLQKMQAQFVYRDRNDKPVYGPVFSSGRSSITIPNGARNNIVNLVVAVTHPNATSGSDDGSNKGFDAQEKFSYQARIVSGGTVAPTTTRPW